MKTLFLFFLTLIALILSITIVEFFDLFEIREAVKYSNLINFHRGDKTTFFTSIAPTEETILEKIKQNIYNLFVNSPHSFTGELSKLNDKDLIRNLKFYTNDSESFTIDKRVIYICVKNHRKKQYYDENLLMYVTLHELSHVICDEIGHTEKFKLIFSGILNYAHNMGYFNYNLPLDQKYCK